MGEILENFTNLENDIKVLQKDLQDKDDLIEISETEKSELKVTFEQTARELQALETQKSELEAALAQTELDKERSLQATLENLNQLEVSSTLLRQSMIDKDSETDALKSELANLKDSQTQSLTLAIESQASNLTT